MFRSWLGTLVLVAALVLSTIVGSTAAQRSPADDIQESQLLARRSVTAFREQVREHLSAADRRIEEAIEYEVAPSWNVNAFAFRTPSGQRRIQVFAGDFRILQWISMSVVAPRWGASPACVTGYLQHVTDGILDNSRRATTGQTLKPVYEFWQYTRQYPRACPGLSAEAYGRDQEGQANVQSVHGASIKWVLSHELGHHLRGHVDDRNRAIDHVRDQEKEADLFALHELTRESPGDVFLALPSYLLVSALSCSKADEPKDSHPSGAWRISLAGDTIREFVRTDPDLRKWARETGQLAALERSVDQFLDAIEAAP